MGNKLWRGMCTAFLILNLYTLSGTHSDFVRLLAACAVVAVLNELYVPRFWKRTGGENANHG